LGKFCWKNITLVIKKQFSRATKGFSQDGDGDLAFAKKILGLLPWVAPLPPPSL
jgi:hypothetical protein